MYRGPVRRSTPRAKRPREIPKHSIFHPSTAPDYPSKTLTGKISALKGTTNTLRNRFAVRETPPGREDCGAWLRCLSLVVDSEATANHTRALALTVEDEAPRTGSPQKAPTPFTGTRRCVFGSRGCATQHDTMIRTDTPPQHAAKRERLRAVARTSLNDRRTEFAGGSRRVRSRRRRLSETFLLTHLAIRNATAATVPRATVM